MMEYTINLLDFINNHIHWLSENDMGACNLWASGDTARVDIEWNDGISSFALDKVLETIRKKGCLLKDDLWELD